MFRQMPPISPSRRREDDLNSAPIVEVCVVVDAIEAGVSGCVGGEEESLLLDKTPLVQKMDLVEFGREVSVHLKTLTNALQVVSAQRVLKVHKFREMLDHLDKLKKIVDDIVITTHETKLISLNTLISASRCGLKGQSLVFVVNEVSGICDQSEKYLGEIENSVIDTRNTISSVMSVVTSTIENDYNLFTIVKGQIDHYIGKLVSAEELLCAMINDSVTGDQAQVVARQFRERMERDLRNLAHVLTTALKHLRRLSSRLVQRGLPTEGLDAAARSIENMCSARLEIQVS